MDEWIRTTADIDSNDYVSGQAKANNLRYQNIHCFDCGRQGHLKSDCRHSVPRDFSRRPQLSGIAEDVVRVGFGLTSAN